MLMRRLPMPTTSTSPKLAQGGYLLIEVLVALLIFSTGILAIFSLQAASIQNSSDAKYRSDASFLANQIVGYMWGQRASLAAYSHRAGGSACSPSGSASTNANVSSWLLEVNNALPGAASNRQQIIVNAATGMVTVTICWRAPNEPTDHSFTAIAQIQG